MWGSGGSAGAGGPRGEVLEDAVRGEDVRGVVLHQRRRGRRPDVLGPRGPPHASGTVETPRGAAEGQTRRQLRQP